MRVLLANEDGTALFTNMDAACFSCGRKSPLGETETVACEIDGESRRRRRAMTTHGQLYVCCPNSEVPSKKVFRRIYDAIASLLPSVDRLRARLEVDSSLRSTRLIHNLKTINAKSIQEVFAIVSQYNLSKQSYREQVAELEKAIRSDPRAAARAILRINKNNIATKCEFGSFAKYYDENPQLQIRTHEVHRVLLNILHPFFPDFVDKDVYVDVDPCVHKVDLDYETFQVALFHLIDNAAKYTSPNSTINIRFPRTDRSQSVVFEMTSLAIPDDEAEMIFADGYSTSDSRDSGSAGDGLGLGIAKRLFGYNGATLDIRRNISPAARQVHDGKNYERNAFEVRISL